MRISEKDRGVLRGPARSKTEQCLEKTRGCVVEIVTDDTHTCRHEPERMWQWTRLGRRAAEAHDG